MIRSLFCLYALVAISISVSCTQPGKGVDWPKIAQCGPAVNDIIGTVERILLADGPTTQTTLSDRAKSELEDLARAHGADTVACVLDQVIQDWTAPGAAANEMRFAALKRGQSFLQAIGTQVQRDPGEQPSSSLPRILRVHGDLAEQLRLARLERARHRERALDLDPPLAFDAARMRAGL